MQMSCEYSFSTTFFVGSRPGFQTNGGGTQSVVLVFTLIRLVWIGTDCDSVFFRVKWSY